jgi:hypothetical protein
METLGHSQIGLTMNTYSHVIPALQSEAATQMDAVLRAVAEIGNTIGNSWPVGRPSWVCGTSHFERKSLEGPVGFEPTTGGLKVPCSATELRARPRR